MRDLDRIELLRRISDALSMPPDQLMRSSEEAHSEHPALTDLHRVIVAVLSLKDPLSRRRVIEEFETSVRAVGQATTSQ
ncbi:hypothetical protein [Aureimonas sp. AU20]|uniref:hypothetical protein n=1 Tax=Aureimonas sp. AU20 TaxID=1349819 RepID=UPI0011E067EA|nr:hypothetical protein [Aureimonas sp. AU20]